MFIFFVLINEETRKYLKEKKKLRKQQLKEFQDMINRNQERSGYDDDDDEEEEEEEEEDEDEDNNDVFESAKAVDDANKTNNASDQNNPNQLLQKQRSINRSILGRQNSTATVRAPETSKHKRDLLNSSSSVLSKSVVSFDIEKINDFKSFIHF